MQDEDEITGLRGAPNYGMSIAVNLVCRDLAGHLPLPLGVLGHEGSTVIVGLNGLRLLRASNWHPGA